MDVCTPVLYLLVGLQFAAYHSEGVGHGVVIDLDAAEGRTVRSCRHPALVGVIIQHDCRPHLADTGLTVGGTDDEKKMMSCRVREKTIGWKVEGNLSIVYPVSHSVCWDRFRISRYIWVDGWTDKLYHQTRQEYGYWTIQQNSDFLSTSNANIFKKSSRYGLGLGNKNTSIWM